MKISKLSLDALRRALNIRDLTNEPEGHHAMQIIVQDIIKNLQHKWGCEVKIYRESPIVSISDNYDKLKYPQDGASRDARYTRYVCDTALLRTQTSAIIPNAMRSIANNLPNDILLACPGLVYRRDCIDKLHVGEPHQIDLWRIRQGNTLTSNDLLEMIRIIIQAALPGMQWRVEPRIHPYTLDGLQIDVLYNNEWVEVGECGLAHPAIIAENIPNIPELTGLAMGLGLDRILMLRKGINDIRLLRSMDQRVIAQMNDLNHYKEVSSMPPVLRDLSIVIDENEISEDLGDRVREALRENADIVESVEILSQTLYQNLPESAVKRLGIKSGQKNILLRVVLRALDRTLTTEECNRYRDMIYMSLHEGTVWMLAEKK